MAHIKLGELLVKTGHLSQESLLQALDEQKKFGGRLGRILKEMNLVSEDILMKALTKQLGLPRAELGSPAVPQEVLARIDARFAMENRLCPERYDAKSRTLVIAMEDHLNVPAIDELAAKTGVRVATSLAKGDEIDAGLARLYPGHPVVQTSTRQDGGDQGQAVFETKDFGSISKELSNDGLRRDGQAPMFDSGDFRGDAAAVREDDSGVRPGRDQMFSTGDFGDAAQQIQDDDSSS